jgi:NACalpha-BTF3-like transcription factor
VFRTTIIDVNQWVTDSDIELVMTQAHVSREAASDALARHQGYIVNAILELTINRRDIVRIGNGVEVTESDIQHVMTACHVDRGMAVRALRHHRGDALDAISWISMLPPVVHLRPPPPRDPVSEPSDEQATAWFIQRMFRDEGVSGYHWNSYSDMVGRTKTTTRNRNEFWMHLQFNGFENEGGYESA